MINHARHLFDFLYAAHRGDNFEDLEFKRDHFNAHPDAEYHRPNGYNNQMIEIIERYASVDAGDVREWLEVEYIDTKPEYLFEILTQFDALVFLTHDPALFRHYVHLLICQSMPDQTVDVRALVNLISLWWYRDPQRLAVANPSSASREAIRQDREECRRDALDMLLGELDDAE